MELTRRDTAAAIGIDETSLDRMVREGCPVLERNGKGTPSRYDLPAVVRWVRQRDVDKAIERAERKATDDDLTQLKARRLELQNEIVEMDLLRRKGDLVLADEIGDAMGNLVLVTRMTLLNTTPARIARRIVGETSETAIIAAVTDEIRQALINLADADVHKIIGAPQEAIEELATDAA